MLTWASRKKPSVTCTASTALRLLVVAGLLGLLPPPGVVGAPSGFLGRLFQGGQGQARVGADQRAVDLSHTVGADTIFWPGFPTFNLSHLVQGRMPEGFW